MCQRRRKAISSIGNYHCRLRELQGRRQHVTLANTGANRLAGKPGFSQCISFPLGVGQDSLLLSGRINPGDLTQPKGGQNLCHRINAHAISEVVIIGIAGLSDGHSQIDFLCVTGASDSQRPIAIPPIVTG